MANDTPAADAAPAAPRPGWARRIGFAVALVVVVLGGAWLGGELVLRAWVALGGPLGDALARHDDMAVQIAPLGTHGYRQRADARLEYPNGTVATANRQGFRGPEVAVPKPAGTFRILLFGGSTTHGWHVNDDETIDAWMRRQLDTLYPGRALEVVNLGYDGHDAYQLIERLRHQGLALEPDAVVINTGVNDVRSARLTDLGNPDPRTLVWGNVLDRLRREAAQRGPGLWVRVKHHSYLARLPGFLLTRMSRRQTAADSLTAAGRPMVRIAPELPPELFLDNAHLTPEGNRAMAARLVRALIPHLDDWSRRAS